MQENFSKTDTQELIFATGDTRTGSTRSACIPSQPLSQCSPSQNKTEIREIREGTGHSDGESFKVTAKVFAGGVGGDGGMCVFGRH